MNNVSGEKGKLVLNRHTNTCDSESLNGLSTQPHSPLLLLADSSITRLSPAPTHPSI